MSLTLYYHPASPPSNMVIAVLQHLNIEYEKKVIKLEEGEHKLEDYLKINPYGQVPTITDGDFCLNESIAIWRYLVQSKAESCDFYPFADAKKVAKINALLDHLLCAYIPGVTVNIFSKVINKAIFIVFKIIMYNFIINKHF